VPKFCFKWEADIAVRILESILENKEFGWGLKETENTRDEGIPR
jgi:hypothetical protein